MCVDVFGILFCFYSIYDLFLAGRFEKTEQKTSNLIILRSDHSDEDLIKLMRADDRHAFNEIYERYWLKLYLSAFKKLRSADDAKDLVQDLFFSLWIKRYSLVVSTSLSAYLFTAVKYRIINHIESNIVKGRYLESLNKTLTEYDDSTSAAIAADDLGQRIDGGIKMLSPKMREVFELSRYENLSVYEIAERLQLSEQTVKNQISRALKILRLHVRDVSAMTLFLYVLLVP